MSSISLLDRSLGAYLGFAVGDALGATVEFMTPGEIRHHYGVHREVIGGGWLSLKPGEVTDDTQMCLVLGQVMVQPGGWDLHRIADEWVNWMKKKPVDIGNTVRRGLRRYLQEGTVQAEASEENAGNGGLMRNLPVVLGHYGQRTLMQARSLEQSRITHANTWADAAVVAFADITHSLLAGEAKEAARARADRLAREEPVFSFAPFSGESSAFVVDSVRTVFDAFFTTDSFEACVLKAVNRGGDADTHGALAAQLAGAHYGLASIPARWLRRMDNRVIDQVGRQTSQLLRLTPEGASSLPSPMPEMARPTGLRRWF